MILASPNKTVATPSFNESIINRPRDLVFLSSASSRTQNSDGLRYPDEKGIEDYLLWIQLITEGGKFKHIRENAIVYHRSMNATSSLGKRIETQITAPALDQFMKFQLSALGKTDKQGARIALSGGGYCVSLREILKYYILIIRKAPPRARVNLFHNCTIMFLKCLVLRNFAK